MKFTICYPCELPFTINQKWGENKEFYSTIGMDGHNGWDLGVRIGTPVYATHDGVVMFAGFTPDGAGEVTVQTVDNYEFDGVLTKFRTYYDHLSEIKATPGAMVKRGDLIGLSGNTGRYTTGPHLHFGIHRIINEQDFDKNRFNGAIDPVHFFDGTYPSSGKLPDHFMRLQDALKDFQVKEGITTYPQVGPNTKRKLNKYLAKEFRYKI